MNISAIIEQLETLAPLSLQESYDNSGLIVGDCNTNINSALLCLDSTEDVIDEAIERNCGLVIAHHPIVFSGIKSLTGKNYIERTIVKAIKNDIAIYAIHTNLDNIKDGVNKKMAERIGLKNLKILSPKGGKLKKLVFFCPIDSSEKVKSALFDAGGGTIGEYDCCSFSVEGNGTFRPGEHTNPHVGKKGELHIETEHRIELVFPDYLRSNLIHALKSNHPYEEVAFDLYSLENKWSEVGSGMIGELPEPLEILDFLDRVKLNLGTECIRYTKVLRRKVKRVAICGGSGSFLLNSAIAKGAEVFITGDYKYHQFFDADGKIVIADVGHFESEQHTPELIREYLQEKLPNFATYLTQVNTNPINYR
jgi:dinuclear metal center YbgI/SA1388 family protein